MRLWVAIVVALACGSRDALAQQPASRTEEIERARREKQATLWPERENPLVARANGLLDRGLGEGLRSGAGANGWQLLFAGTREGQGQALGVGYRRSDLLRDALTARAAIRGTLAGAVVVDAAAELNRLRQSADTFVTLSGRYERSPRMEFYGLGRDSRKEDRTRYLLNTFTGELRAGYRFTPDFNIGVDLLGGGAHTGPTSGEDVPSIEAVFDATTAPGLFDDTTFLGFGGFAAYDTRDIPRGPRRGGFYGVNFNRYVDLSGGTYTNRQLSIEGQQFFPYFNATRVVELMASVSFAYTGRDDRVVPFYLLPKLGGANDLRGFNEYRFHDNNAFRAAIEHRWYVFTGLEMAAFVDAGKTVSEKWQIDFSGLNYSGGIGFRARLNDAIVLRFDIARSREGLRWIWSMSDISRRRF
jgi:outer membrane protein assembly factor BamA